MPQYSTQKRKKAELTLDDYILACLLVPLTSATNLVGQPIALVVQRLAPLANRVVCHQPPLDAKDQQRGAERRPPLTVTKILHPWRVAGVVAQAPLLRVCSTWSNCSTLGNSRHGVGSSSSGEPADPWASDSPSLAWAVGARMSVTTGIGVAVPPVAIQAFVAQRASASSLT